MYTEAGRVYFWGQLQSHHVLQAAWAKEVLKEYGYSENKAPTITLETNGGLWDVSRGWYLPHTQISIRQGDYNDLHPIENSSVEDLQSRLIEGASDLLSTGIDRSVVDEQLERNFRMIEALKSANAQAIQDGTLADLRYDRNEIMEVLDQRFPNSRTDTGDVTRQEGILFTKCGKG